MPLALFCGEQMPGKGEHVGRGTAEIRVVLNNSGITLLLLQLRRAEFRFQ